MSCAIVWQNHGHIYYGQTREEHIMTIPPIRVCTDQSAFCRHPNVGYKTFRRDSIDVVWTAGERPPYRVMYRRMAKQYGPVGVDDRRTNEELPRTFNLMSNYPNPFLSGAKSFALGGGNPGTVIEYHLPRAAEVKVSIFNVQGQKVITLVRGYREAGYHKIIWKGTDEFGHPAAIGVYFYQLQTVDFVAARKMLLIR
jgi:hypothetical protein